MKFDAVEKKKQATKKKPKKVSREIDRLTRVYPVAGTTEDQYIKLNVRGRVILAAFFDTRKYDLELLDDEEADFVTETYWSFQKQYGGSVKEIFMNFPEENQRQQSYVKYKRDHSKELHQMRILQAELEKLKFIEKTYKKLASYLVLYGETEKELNDNISLLRRFDNLFQAKQLNKEYVAKILEIMNNTGGVSIYEDEER